MLNLCIKKIFKIIKIVYSIWVNKVKVNDKYAAFRLIKKIQILNMKQNSSFTQDNEIDLLEFIRKLWKEKILIISVSLLFMVIGYVYGTLQPKTNKIKILLREAPYYLFESQTNNLDSLRLAKEFNFEFKINLYSSETLDRFIEQNNKIDQFKINLASKNIEIKKYFKSEFKIDEKTDNLWVYYLSYGEYLPGEEFLNDFILFVKKETEKSFQKQRSLLIIDQINQLKVNLEISKKINLENPLVGGEFNLYNRGTKVLSYQIDNLNNILKETKLLKLDYNPIVEKTSSVGEIKNHPLDFAVIAFLLGFFFSLIIIFTRFLLQNKH